ncbi:PAS/PAC sensor signal transduction histidine kinase [Alkalilimnicola ehrlichii MLHE-1]|uniref:histidine kinase n=1 Tax=Alkalilimnicola ehrlichii (strain ATCC BAA-1101 / DSM 17681 / MLHE-1) TaxID=187272 RepID=Q0A6P3_ALKEH|nr:PAS/PAC sensor signal transduction histidine kinase [Alkalilimnicola ehrlichii MLHE-1]
MPESYDSHPHQASAWREDYAHGSVRASAIVSECAHLLSLAPPATGAGPLRRLAGVLGQALQADHVVIHLDQGEISGFPESAVHWHLHPPLQSSERLTPRAYEQTRDWQRMLDTLSPGVWLRQPDRSGIDQAVPLPKTVEGVMAERRVRSLLLFPLVSGGRPLGMLAVEQAGIREDWDDSLARGLMPVGCLVAGYIAQVGLVQERRGEAERYQGLITLGGLGQLVWWPGPDRLQWFGPATRVLGLPPSGQGHLAQLERAGALPDAAPVVSGFRDAAAGAVGLESEVRVAVSDPRGTGQGRRWYQLRFRRESGSQEDRVLAVLYEITGEVEAREAHRVSAYALESVAEKAGITFYSARLEGHRLLPDYVSSSSEGLLGQAVRNLPAQERLSSLTHPADLAIIKERVKQLQREGQFSAIYRLRTADGGYRWVYEGVQSAGGGNVVGMFWDVTRRQQLEQAIADSERRYKAIVDDAPAFICRYTTDFRIVFHNTAFFESFIEPLQGEQDGVTWLDLLPEEERVGIGDRLGQLTPLSPIISYELRMQVPGRGVRWVTWSERGFFSDDGDLLEVQAVGHDNTEIKSAQEKLIHAAKMATVGEMATGVAHEINQPLNVIKMASFNARRNLAKGEAGLEQVGKKLDRIIGQVERAAAIIQQMRVFGRKSDPEARLFSVVAAIEDALVLIQEQFTGNGLQVTFEDRARGACQVLGNQDQLVQVLLNLMINSRDAIRERAREQGNAEYLQGEWITLKLESIDDDGGREMLRIRVQDSGPGISDAALGHLFDPFFTTKEVGEGTGLGLSVSFGIVKSMGGVISARNTDAGAEFTVDLPAVEERTL